MLTLSKPISAGQAQAYHKSEFANAKENYYTEGERVRGEWQGQLATRYGLRGEVNEEQFARLSEGQHPATGEALIRPSLPSPAPEWLQAAEQLVAAHPGTLLERKARGFALHFRAVPAAGPALHDALAALLSGSDTFELLPAHMLWEVRPRGVDKGKAVRLLLARPPFAGRKPVFIGDDVTDEDAIRAARALGGAGFHVADAFGSPSGVRAWLRGAAATGDWPALR